jgi:hypothetical protein
LLLHVHSIHLSAVIQVYAIHYPSHVYHTVDIYTQVIQSGLINLVTFAALKDAGLKRVLDQRIFLQGTVYIGCTFILARQKGF